jgi:preprotein translocase subunit YajC
MKQMLIEIEKNIGSRKETDRVMWFSMWILLSVASFGIAWFLMIYSLVKRRNAHFSRQEKLEALILSKLRQLNGEKQLYHNNASNFTKKENPICFRDAQLWALSTILVVPAFYVLYFLSMDLQKHEENESKFLMEIVSLTKGLGFSIDLDGFTITKKFAFDSYLIISIITCGFAAVYWLYRIFNDYNRHFKRQWKLEDELLMFFKSADRSEAG